MWTVIKKSSLGTFLSVLKLAQIDEMVKLLQCTTAAVELAPRARAQWNMNFKTPFAPFLFYMDLYKSNLSHKILNAKNLGAFFSLHFMLLLLQLSYIFPTPNFPPQYFVFCRLGSDEKP